MENIAFYSLSFFLLLSALAVSLSRYPVYSVLYLIVAFINAAGLFILLNAEFLAMVMIILYVGAVAILFLFLVMMLHSGKKECAYAYPYLIIAGSLSVTMMLILNTLPDQKRHLHIISLTELGNVFYTEYAQLFLLLGIILLVVMVGAVVLGKDSLSLLKQQRKQINRQSSIELVKVPSHQGVKIE